VTGKQGIFHTKGGKKEPAQRTLAYKIGHPSVVKSANEDAATITLRVVGDPWGDGTGFQALLDAEHAIDLDAIFSVEEFYDICDYTIPEGASADLTDLVIVLDDEVSITVPEGLYDIIFLNPDQYYGVIYPCYWYDNIEEIAFGDDFPFKAGYEYVFTIEEYDLVEYYLPVDLALTQLILPLSSADLTDSEEIGVVLSNVGTQAISSVELSYQVNDGETLTETYVGTLAPGSQTTYTFNAKADFSKIGVHTVTAWLTYEDDMNLLNNQATASVTMLPEHDICISKVESPASFPRQIPQYQQVEGEKIFNVVIQNLGISAETGSVELKMNSDNNLLATADFTLPIPGEVKVPLSVTFPVLPLGPLNLQFNANISAGDQIPNDNSLQITKIISDSTYVWDSIDSDFPSGVGVNGIACTFGLIYELVKKDVLTSINIGLAVNDFNDDFGIAVYPVDDELVVGEPYFTQEQPRQAGSSIVFDVPDTELEPGKYMFAIQQLTGNSVAIAYDRDPNGYFYGNLGKGWLLIDSSSGLGFIHIRPNFGKNVAALPEAKAIDLSLQLYPNPVVDILLVRIANQRIEKVSVYDASGATVYKAQGINNFEYKLPTGSLAPGFYFITVQTPTGVKTDKFVVKK
jgi:hypothetical protein